MDTHHRVTHIYIYTCECCTACVCEEEDTWARVQETGVGKPYSTRLPLAVVHSLMLMWFTQTLCSRWKRGQQAFERCTYSTYIQRSETLILGEKCEVHNIKRSGDMHTQHDAPELLDGDMQQKSPNDFASCIIETHIHTYRCTRHKERRGGARHRLCPDYTPYPRPPSAVVFTIFKAWSLAAVGFLRLRSFISSFFFRFILPVRSFYDVISGPPKEK